MQEKSHPSTEDRRAMRLEVYRHVVTDPSTYVALAGNLFDGVLRTFGVFFVGLAMCHTILLLLAVYQSPELWQIRLVDLTMGDLYSGVVAGFLALGDRFGAMILHLVSPLILLCFVLLSFLAFVRKWCGFHQATVELRTRLSHPDRRALRLEVYRQAVRDPLAYMAQAGNIFYGLLRTFGVFFVGLAMGHTIVVLLAIYLNPDAAHIRLADLTLSDLYGGVVAGFLGLGEWFGPVMIEIVYPLILACSVVFCLLAFMANWFGFRDLTANGWSRHANREPVCPVRRDRGV